jgi:hypothetical protein
MKFEVANEEELQHYKDRAMMLKMLSLDQMGKDVMTNPSTFSKRDKIRLQVEIEKHWDDKDIVERFNELCAQTIFEDGKMITENLSVKQKGEPEVPEAVKQELEENIRKREEEKRKKEEEVMVE